MLILFTSISCSVAVSVLLKLARKHQIDIAQAIAVNYVVAASLCFFILRPAPASLLSPATPWWILALLGFLLPSVFLIMAAAVRHAGIVLSDAAQRLSLFLPLIASFLIFQEALTQSKALGIGVALIALACLLFRPGRDNSSPSKIRSHHTVLVLLGVWFGYGVIDILFKQLAKSGAAFPSSLFASFVLAGVLIFTWLTISRTQWARRNMIAGLLLGLLNFGNIYFYIRAHQIFPENPTLVFSAMNIGVISIGTLVGAGFFREKLSWVNILGVALAIAAILLLIPRV